MENSRIIGGGHCIPIFKSWDLHTRWEQKSSKATTSANSGFLCWQTEETSPAALLSPVVLAEGKQLNNRIIFLLWFINWLQLRADIYKIPAQQKADDRWQSF